MKYAVEMGSVAMIHIFHNDWFMGSKFHKGDPQTQRRHGDSISQLLFFQNVGSRLKAL
jgi:hypothetical protein